MSLDSGSCAHDIPILHIGGQLLPRLYLIQFENLQIDLLIHGAYSSHEI